MKHCAGQLAAATYAANNHREQYLDEKGKLRTRCRRDSQDIPKALRKGLKPLKALEPRPSKPPAAVVAHSSSDSDSEAGPSAQARSRASRASAKRNAECIEKAAFDAIVQARRKNPREVALELHRGRQLPLSSLKRRPRQLTASGPAS